MAVPDAFAITNITRENGLSLDDQQASLLERYVGLLQEWNTKINLISRRDAENVWTAHILHALSILFSVQMPPRIRVLDLGSGGGLPGIPLAIARPDLTVVLLDSVAKKMRAVGDIISRLGLQNVSVVCARAEDAVRRKDCAGMFDCVVARAVAPLTDLIRWAKPLARRPSPLQLGVRGTNVRQLPQLICLKGGDLEGELRQAAIKTGALDADVLEIVVRGGPVAGLEEKKLVIVSL